MKNKIILQNIYHWINNCFSKNVIAKDKQHLEKLIYKEICEHGYHCDLNHINVSRIKDFTGLFASISIRDRIDKEYSPLFDLSRFNGDISQWEMSNAKKLYGMFWESKFNGDISNWNISNVIDMQAMFVSSHFNGDISKWDTSNVINMKSLFADSQFNGDVSNWNVYKVEDMENIFYEADFTRDISKWLPYNLKVLKGAFKNTDAIPPYWANFDDQEKRNIAINNYLLNKELTDNLSNNRERKTRIKL